MEDVAGGNPTLLQCISCCLPCSIRCRYYVWREFQRSIADSVYSLLQMIITEAKLENYFTFTQKSIKSLSGAEFKFAGVKTNPQSVKSIAGIDLCWVEEAAFISEASMDLLLPSILRKGTYYKEGRFIHTFNPRSKTDPVYQLFVANEEKPPGSRIEKMNYTENTLCPKSTLLLADYDKRHYPDKYTHIWLGEAVQRGTDMVFSNFDPAKDQANLDDLITDDHTPYIGLDFGFFPDPCACVVAYLLDDGETIYVKEEGKQVKVRPDDIPGFLCGNYQPTDKFLKPWRNPLSFNGHEAVRRGFPVTCDSARNDTIKHIQDFGIQARPCKKHKGSVMDGIEFLLGKRLVINPDCKMLIDEVLNYRYKLDPKDEETVLPKIEDRQDDHLLDALRYAFDYVRLNTTQSIGGGAAGSYMPMVFDKDEETTINY